MLTVGKKAETMAKMTCLQCPVIHPNLLHERLYDITTTQQYFNFDSLINVRLISQSGGTLLTS